MLALPTEQTFFLSSPFLFSSLSSQPCTHSHLPLYKHSTDKTSPPFTSFLTYVISSLLVCLLFFSLHFYPLPLFSSPVLYFSVLLFHLLFFLSSSIVLYSLPLSCLLSLHCSRMHSLAQIALSFCALMHSKPLYWLTWYLITSAIYHIIKLTSAICHMKLILNVIKVCKS